MPTNLVAPTAGSLIKAQDVSQMISPVNSLELGETWYAEDTTNTNNYAITLSPAPTAYTAAMLVEFRVTNGNTAAVTLNCNSLGPKDVRFKGQPLQSGMIRAGQIVFAVYDATAGWFQINNPAPPDDLVQGSGSSGQVTFWDAQGDVAGDGDLSWDDTNQRLGLGTATPQRRLHVAKSDAGITELVALDNPDTTADNGASLSFRTTTTGTGAASFVEMASLVGVVTDHTHTTYESRLAFQVASGGALAEKLRLDGKGNLVLGSGSLPTSATDGFLYLPTTSGDPTGTPTAFTGRVPMLYQTDTDELRVYSGGGWRILPAGALVGTGAAGQVAFWTGDDEALGGDADYFWDNTNKRLGIGTTTPSVKLDVNDDSVRVRTSQTPTGTSAGSAGEIAWDANYLYVCTATDTWKRVSLSSF